MTTTTHPEFNDTTEALEVASAFPDSIRGKCILIVGVNPQGLGFTTAQAFASQHPRQIIVAGRTVSKLQESIDAMKKDYPDVEYRALSLDLAHQKAIRESAAQVLSWQDVPVIDIIVNNAAIMKVPQRIINEDGIESTFATNHIGHYLFTNLIMPKLIAASKKQPHGATRVINVSALSPIMSLSMRWSDMNFEKVNKTLPEEEQPRYPLFKAFGISDPEEKAYTGLEAYVQTKIANCLFSIGLNDRLYVKHGILSFACHPGVIRTELGRHNDAEGEAAIEEMLRNKVFTLKTQGAGAATTVTVALDPKLGMPEKKLEEGKENYGVFFSDCQINGGVTPKCSSSAEADRLWTYSEKLVKETFDW